MVTRRDFLKTMSMASAGLALGTGDLLHAQTASPKKGRGDKVKIAYIGIGNRGEQIIERTIGGNAARYRLISSTS